MGDIIIIGIARILRHALELILLHAAGWRGSLCYMHTACSTTDMSTAISYFCMPKFNRCLAG